jgi:hypothetical protein
LPKALLASAAERADGMIDHPVLAQARDRA